MDPDIPRNQIETRLITPDQLGCKRIPYRIAGGEIHEASAKGWHAQKPANQEKVRESPHTLHEKRPAQIKDNANLITVNEAAWLQEQHGGVRSTRQQENEGDNGWIRHDEQQPHSASMHMSEDNTNGEVDFNLLNTGTDNEAAWNEDLEGGAREFGKEDDDQAKE